MTATDAPPSEVDPAAVEPDEPEPFGQTGIRQYVGRLATIVCLAIAMVAGFMWYRSTSVFDGFEWRSPNELLRIASVTGRLKIDYTHYEDKRFNNGGWIYQQQPIMRTVRDGWKPSLYKTVGIEFRHENEEARSFGVWLRVKWYFILGAAMLIPVCRWIMIFQRRREASE
jgi:hypothetical protein